QGMRIALWRQIQLGIKWMQALKAAPTVALASHGNFAKDRRDRTGIETLMSMFLPDRIDDRFGNRARTALIDIALIASSQPLTAINIEELFQFAVSHSFNRLQMRDDRIKLLSSWQVGVSLSGFERCSASCHRAGPPRSEI